MDHIKQYIRIIIDGLTEDVRQKREGSDATQQRILVN